MLETIRQFAEEQVSGRGEASEIRAAHARYFAGWAADHGDLDAGAAIAAYAGFLGAFLENYEPIAWAEELLEPLRAVDHPRLAAVCVVASLNVLVGRFDEAVRYSEIGQTVIATARDKVSPSGASATRPTR
jgi:hypothetical protein